MSRRYQLTVAELIDRLTILQLKEVFLPENKESYAQEIADIVQDLNHEGVSGELIRDIIVLAQMNLHIWHNEAEARKGNPDDNNLWLTHGLNGIRSTARNRIAYRLGERQDLKVDCLAEDFKDWEISW